MSNAVNVDWTRDLQIFNLTLSQLSYSQNMSSTLYMYEVSLKQNHCHISILDFLFPLDERFIP